MSVFRAGGSGSERRKKKYYHTTALLQKYDMLAIWGWTNLWIAFEYSTTTCTFRSRDVGVAGPADETGGDAELTQQPDNATDTFPTFDIIPQVRWVYIHMVVPTALVFHYAFAILKPILVTLLI